MGRCDCGARGVEQAECQAKKGAFPLRRTPLVPANGRNDNTNKDSVQKKILSRGAERGEENHRVVLPFARLGQGMNEFQAEEAKIACRFLAQNASGDRRSFIRNEPGGGRRGSRDCQLNKLVRFKEMRGCNAGAVGTYVQGLGELDELDSQSVRTPQKDRDLDPNTWTLPLLGGAHRVLGL